MGKRGLVSKARRERQMAMMQANTKAREETTEKWITIVKSKQCGCGFKTSGMMMDGQLVCPKCKGVLE
jgi:hypothetical protein